MESDESAIIEGWAEKRGRLRKSWRRRWFVVTSGQLRYFEAPGRSEKGALALPESTTAPLCPGSGGRTFTVMTPQRRLLIRMDQEAEARRWRQAVRYACGASGQPPPPASPALAGAPAACAAQASSSPPAGAAAGGGGGNNKEDGSGTENEATGAATASIEGDDAGTSAGGEAAAADGSGQGGAEVVIKEGMLVKRGTWPPTWRQRHFRLVQRSKRHIVLEYRGEENEEARGFVHLAGAAILPVDVPGRNHTFAVATSERELMLEASSNEEMDAWANTLQHAAIVAAGGFASAGEVHSTTLTPSEAAGVEGAAEVEAGAAEGGGIEAESAAAPEGSKEHARGEEEKEGEGEGLDEEEAEGAGSSSAAVPKPSAPAPPVEESSDEDEDVTLPLHVGAVFWKKMGDESKYHGPRYLWVPHGGQEIRWTKGTQPQPSKSKGMPLGQIRAVRVGKPAKLAKKELKSIEDPDAVCFTLVHAQAKNSLDVRASDSGQLKLWVVGLQALLGSAGGGDGRV